MKIAKDGLPFDVDNVKELKDGEVEIIQFLRPDGKRRRMAVMVGKEIVELAEDQILSCEELTTGQIALYSHFIDEDAKEEFTEIAINGPGENSPTNKLMELIKRKDERRRR